MRIISRAELMKLPEGTIFAYYRPCIFGGLHIKGTTGPHDFDVMSLDGNIECDGSEDFVDILDNAVESGESFDLDFDRYGREGFFDNDQLFAIYEEKDMIGLINTLIEARSKVLRSGGV